MQKFIVHLNRRSHHHVQVSNIYNIFISLKKINNSCKTIWQYSLDTSENSSHFFNSFKTHGNSGQSAKNLLAGKNAWKSPFFIIKTYSTPKNT